MEQITSERNGRGGGYYYTVLKTRQVCSETAIDLQAFTTACNTCVFNGKMQTMRCGAGGCLRRMGTRVDSSEIKT